MPADTSTHARERWPRLIPLLILGAFGFIVIATMNSSGYRYGAADQAFYIPAIRQHLDPTLFPHDSAVLAAHGHFTPYDEIVAALVRVTGVSLPTLFFAGYLVSLVVLYAALIAFGQQIFTSPWLTAMLVGVYTLRHRIARTGANTLEGYFHPRVLVFGLGVIALYEIVRRRPLRAWVLIAIGAVLHPTTALFFAVWIGVALAVNEPRLRRALIATTGLGVVVAGVLLAIGTVSLKPMDATWLATLTDKDYILPMDWPLSAWMFNLLYPAIVVAGFWHRRQRGQLVPGEAGLVAGALVLAALFIVSLPLLMLHSAIAVQFQMSRVFWMVELLAWIYVIIFVAQLVTIKRAWIAMTAVVILISARGWYTWRHDHPDRPLFQIDLPEDAWTDVGRWLREHTTHDAVLMADPGHAWRFGSSLRVSAERDVYIEDIKDIALGMYDRGVAMRNLERRTAMGNFFSLSPAQFQILAARYDLQYLVTDRVEPFDEVYHNAQFHVYRLNASK